MKIKQKIRYLIYKWKWLYILNSPFKKPKIRFYFGKIEQGVPYFLPRKWVKFSQQDMVEKAEKENEKARKLVDEGKVSEEKIRLRKPEEFKGYQKPIPLKWGMQIIGLGWKTKWDSYRHEWNPMISIVGFNKQFCIFFGLGGSMKNMCYWEAWLTYYYDTDKTKNKTERMVELREKYSASWGNSDKGYTDYYTMILK